MLGPTELCLDGRAVALTGRQRALLTALLLDAGRIVPVERIVDRLWGVEPPPSAAARVRSLVAEVRRACGAAGPDLIVTRNPGYLIRVESGELDLRAFTELIDRAGEQAREGRALDAIALFDRALSLWRGTPLMDARGAYAEVELRRLEELRTRGLEERTDAKLAIGRHHEVVADLGELLAEESFRERPRGQLMLALHRGGNTGEALRVYRDFRARLVDELGVEPTAELRRLHQGILNGDPEPAPPDADTVPARSAGQPRLPRQLPPALGRFIGRRPELERLDGLGAGANRLVLIVGPAGVGKTALAVHWAHRDDARFPDGELFLTMRGFDEGEPMSPAEALPLLLQALGQSRTDIPVDVDAQASRYRSLLAGRRLLLLLDDVADPEQVRPLLPGDPGCLVVVTSRDRLDGLVAINGARRVPLEVFERRAALKLLADGVGDDRLAAEPVAADELTELCGCLPLALSVAGAQIAAQRHRTIGDYVRDLTEYGRLGRLRVAGDRFAAVRGALRLSYQALDPPAQRMFRLLGLMPSGGVTSAVAAALAGVPRAEAEDLLDAVTRVHLAAQVGARRFACHDLVLEYAAERGSADDGPAERLAAVRRMFDYYLHTIIDATRAGGFSTRFDPPERPAAGVTPEHFGAAAEAFAWFDTEWENLAAVLAHLAEQGPRSFAWRLVAAMQDLLHHRRSLAEWLRVAELGLTAATHENDLRGRAAMRLSLGDVHWRMADLDAALHAYEHALPLARRAGWERGEALALQGSGVALKQLGELRRAIVRYRKAVDISRRLGYRRGEYTALNNLASAHLTLARLDRAEEYLLLALPLVREAGNKHLEAITLVNLGLVRQKQARFGDARSALTHSMAVAREVGSAYAEAVAHETFGRVHSDVGHYARAIASHEEALRIARLVENRNCQVDALAGLADAELRLGRVDGALEHLHEAARIIEHGGHRVGLVEVVMGLAECHRRLGRYRQARDAAERALRLARTGNPLALGRAHSVLAAVLLDLGDVDGCVQECERALRICARSGQRMVRSRALVVLGHARSRVADGPGARRAWRRAHTLLVTVGAAEQEEVAGLLTA